jgi:hypothetical protein
MLTGIRNIISTIVDISIIFSILICLAAVPPVYAATNTTSVIDPGRTGTLYIDYKEDTEGTQAIAGAEFTVYKIADIGTSGEYVSVISTISNDEIYKSDSNPGDLVSRVQAAYKTQFIGCEQYTAKTGSDGKLSIQSMQLGLYIVVETSPAAKHYASIPFYVAVPYTDNNEWVYSVTAEPKSCPAGDLVITKQVEGEEGETDRDFHFTVSFSDKTDTFVYTKSDGSKGKIKNGGEITLKHGEKAVIEDIPVGTEFTVKETEANTEGYITSATGAKGNIKRTVQKVAAFTNTRRTEVSTGDTYTPYFCGGISLMMLLLAFGLYKKRKASE